MGIRLMGKKIVLIGPPSVGKTTLRKIFFEGESAQRLLEFAVKPTYGKDALMVDFGEEIGIFDLSGQELQRWLESEEREVFFETDLLLVVVDATQPVEMNLETLDRVLSARRSLCRDAFVYFLVHKVDLLKPSRLDELEGKYRERLDGVRDLRVHFSSVAKHFYLATLKIFIELLQEMIGKELLFKNVDFSFLKDAIILLSFLRDKDGVPMAQLQDGLQEFTLSVGRLIERGFLKIREEDGKEMLEILPEGKQYINGVISSFSLDELKGIDTNRLQLHGPGDIDYPFIGLLMCDNLGRTLVVSEAEEGVFKEMFVQNEVSQKQYDIHLIPMFLSALRDFSKEISLIGDDDFHLRGEHFDMSVFDHEGFTLILFTNSGVKLTTFRDEIHNFFKKFVKGKKELLEDVIKTGDMSRLAPLASEASRWIDQLNEQYKDTVENSLLSDFNYLKKVYGNLEELSRRIIEKYTGILKQVKLIKERLTRAFFKDDTVAIKHLLEEGKQIQKEFPG